MIEVGRLVLSSTWLIKKNNKNKVLNKSGGKCDRPHYSRVLLCAKTCGVLR